MTNHDEKDYFLNCNLSLLNDLPKEWEVKLKDGIDKIEADKILDENYMRQLLSIIQEPIIKTRINDVLNHFK